MSTLPRKKEFNMCLEIKFYPTLRAHSVIQTILLPVTLRLIEVRYLIISFEFIFSKLDTLAYQRTG